MSRRAAGALVAVALLVVLAAVAYLYRPRERPVERGPEATAEPAAPEAAAPEVEHRTVTLWLPGPRGRIAPLETEIEAPPTVEGRLAALLAALLAAGPEQGATALFPEPVVASTVLLTPDGTLYLDLRAASGGPPPPAGSTLELQRVYSLVHTVLRNEPEVGAVVLLWNGVQPGSLSGHVDTGHPLTLLDGIELETG